MVSEVVDARSLVMRMRTMLKRKMKLICNLTHNGMAWAWCVQHAGGKVILKFLHCPCCSVAQWCPTLWDPMDYSLPRLLRPWEFPGKNTGVGCHFLLQGIFLTQGLNPHFLHCRRILYL